jgi:hypothetical protein
MQLTAKDAMNFVVLGGMTTLFASTVDIAELTISLLGKVVTLAWRLAAFAFFIKFLFKFMISIILNGGPILALKNAFFVTMAVLFNGASRCFSCLRISEGVADFFDDLASSCEDRSGPSSKSNAFGTKFGAGVNPLDKFLKGVDGGPFGDDARGPISGVTIKVRGPRGSWTSSTASVGANSGANSNSPDTPKDAIDVDSAPE